MCETLPACRAGLQNACPASCGWGGARQSPRRVPRAGWCRTRGLHPRHDGIVAPIRLRLRTGTVAVRYSMPASQPAGGAHIRDGACALGPCPWEVPMQSPKPKAARRFPVPYGFRRYHYNTFKWDIVGHLWRGQQCPYLPDREIRHRRGADGVPACSYSTSPQQSVPTFGSISICAAESHGPVRW